MTAPSTSRSPSVGRGSHLSRLGFGSVAVLSLVMLFLPADGVPTGLPISDKVVHGLLFAALGLTGHRAGFPAVPLLAALVAYAAGSELLQAVLPIGRDGTLGDGIADVVGATGGLLLALALRARAGRRHLGSGA